MRVMSFRTDPVTFDLVHRIAEMERGNPGSLLRRLVWDEAERKGIHPKEDEIVLRLSARQKVHIALGPGQTKERFIAAMAQYLKDQ